jgi:hypothetical protein
MRFKHSALLTSLLLPLIACGKGGRDGSRAGESTGGRGSNLPIPPAGLATVGGKVTVDGKPRAGEEINLNVSAEEKNATVKTAIDGSFVFEQVQPGTYYLDVGVLVKGIVPRKDSFGPLAWDDPCSAPGFSMVLNSFVSDRTSGKPVGVIAAANNAGGEGRREKPFNLKAGDRLEQSIAFRCTSVP